MSVGYFVSRFPKITETFILREMIELERLGTPIELFALTHEREGVAHEEARAFSGRAHYGNEQIGATLVANLGWLIRRPLRYANVWWNVLWAHRNTSTNVARAAVTTFVAAGWATSLERSHVERVHAHWATWPTLAAWVVRELTGIPYTFTTHAHDLYLDRSMLDSKIAAAERVVTISDFNRRILQSEYGAGDKTVVVRCGVELDRYAFSLPAANGRASFVIVCVAALEDYKGHEHLVRACRIVRDRGVDVRCLLVGEGPRRAAIETLIAALELTNRVELLGRRPSDEVVELVRAADAVALASVVTPEGKMEGIPVALMEAMALGRPVIATDISGVAELVSDRVSGRLVPPGDPVALAEAFVELARTPELRERITRAGRLRVEEDYDLRKNVAHLHRVLSPADDTDRQLDHSA